MRGRAPSRKKSREDAENRKTLFVGNLPFSYSIEDIFKIFQRHERIAEVFLPHFPGTSKSRGYAFICFMYEDNAHAAIRVLDGKKINGRTVAVKEARPKSHRRPDSSGVQTQGANLQAGNSEEGKLPNKCPVVSHRGWEKPPAQMKRPHLVARSVTADPEGVARKLLELQLGLVGDSVESKEQEEDWGGGDSPRPTPSDHLGSVGSYPPHKGLTDGFISVYRQLDLSIDLSSYHLPQSDTGAHTFRRQEERWNKDALIGEGLSQASRSSQFRDSTSHGAEKEAAVRASDRTPFPQPFISSSRDFSPDFGHGQGVRSHRKEEGFCSGSDKWKEKLQKL
ncbi:uncharacterized protein LOC131224228 [Magnolia sinica]|uniref:uncharacterized protein LOC131224228 n=1 Tax=Magnolia sinica TaxID=86752 RepID=UPI00265B2CB2|nr:uncharacterized protein LOC131224228 [Magnolia sinica]